MSKLEDKLTASIKANRGQLSKKPAAKKAAPKKANKAKGKAKSTPTPKVLTPSNAVKQQENSKPVERKSSTQELHPRRVWPD